MSGTGRLAFNILFPDASGACSKARLKHCSAIRYLGLMIRYLRLFLNGGLDERLLL